MCTPDQLKLLSFEAVKLEQLAGLNAEQFDCDSFNQSMDLVMKSASKNEAGIMRLAHLSDLMTAPDMADVTL